MKKPSSKILESKVQASIRKLLKDNGWLVIKIILASENGWPDLMAMKAGRVIFFEVKRPGETSRPLQVYRRNQLHGEGIECYEVDSLKKVKLYLE